MKRPLIFLCTILLLSGCFLKKNEDGHHICGEVGVCEPPLQREVPWRKALNCSGAAGSYEVLLSQESLGGSLYQFDVRTSPLGGSLPTNLGMKLTNASLLMSENLSPTRFQDLYLTAEINQATLDAFPTLKLVVGTGETACAIPQNPNTAWRPDQRATLGGAVFQSSFTFNSQPISALQMAVSGTKLVLSGTPFGMLQANISQPTAPSLDWAASDDITSFTNNNMFSFAVERDASRALLVRSDGVLSAGTLFLDRINNGAQPIMMEQESEISGVVGMAEVSGPQILVAHEHGEITQWSIDQNGLLPSGEMSIDATLSSIAPLNSGALLAASDGLYRVWTGESFEPQSIAQGDFTGSLVASNDYIFFYADHAVARGLYVFNHDGKTLAFLNIARPISFAVSEDGKTLFANQAGQRVDIYHLQW